MGTKAKVGRPRKPPGRARNEVVALRVSELERRELEARAERAGLSVREYLRYRLDWSDQEQ